MKSRLCCVLISLLPFCTSAQYTQATIEKAGEEYLRQIFGEKLKWHCRLQEIRYGYFDDKKRLWEQTMSDSQSVTVGPIDKVYTDYFFVFRFPDYRQVDVTGEFTITMDKDLQLILKPNLSFLPNYIWTAQEPDFISQEQAMAIVSETAFPMDGSRKAEVSLSYIAKDELYAYVFATYSEVIRSSGMKTNTDDLEIAVVDAKKGSLVAYEKGDAAISWIMKLAREERK